MARRAEEESPGSASVPAHAPPWEVRTGPEAQLEHPAPSARVQRSGVYTRRSRHASQEAPLAAAQPVVSEELRVDVDGLFPTMTVSGTIFRLAGGYLSWIARVTWEQDSAQYVGSISYRDGVSSLELHTNIAVRLTGSSGTSSMQAHVLFTGGGQPDHTRVYDYARPSFREVHVEFAGTGDAGPPVTSYSLGAHPNRPADLPDATLSIEDIFSRQGIEMTNAAGGTVLPIADAGAGRQWSDVETHDAMQLHWFKCADTPRWRIWTLLAGHHEIGHQLGGILFSDPSVAWRQGCAVFCNSFFSDEPPVDDPNPTAFIRRTKFWATVHEIGHALHLGHSGNNAEPWIPLADEAEVRTFMSDPYQVSGNAEAFFANFHFRFSDEELLILRHAPELLVRQSNATWFDHHTFEHARQAGAAPLELTLRANRRVPRYQALEPVIGELRLKNTSAVPVVVDRHCLTSEDVTIVLAGQRGHARRWLPYAQHCLRAEPLVLQPGESIYASCFLSAGRNGCDLAEPGQYRVYAALRTPVGHVLAPPMTVRIDPPASREEERLAQDIFSDEVSRVLAFGGSRVLSAANEILRDAHRRLPGRRIAMHAAAALVRVETSPGRVLVDQQGRADQRRFELSQPCPEEATPELDTAYSDLDAAAETFGHLRLTDQIERAATALADSGDSGQARNLTARLANSLEKRGVLTSVVRRLRQRSEELRDRV